MRFGQCLTELEKTLTNLNLAENLKVTRGPWTAKLALMDIAHHAKRTSRNSGLSQLGQPLQKPNKKVTQYILR